MQYKASIKEGGALSLYRLIVIDLSAVFVVMSRAEGRDADCGSAALEFGHLTSLRGLILSKDRLL
jgi:hypothetical protein